MLQSCNQLVIFGEKAQQKVYLPFRFTHHKAIADERRAYEAKMKPIWDAEERARKEKANREQLLVLAKEAGVKVSLRMFSKKI